MTARDWCELQALLMVLDLLLAATNRPPEECKAIEDLRPILNRWIARADAARSGSTGVGNPWIDSFGRCADDPQWEEYQAALQRIRNEENSDGSR